MYNKIFKKIIFKLFENLPLGIPRSILLTIYKFKTLSPLNMLRLGKSYIISLIFKHIICYPSPAILTYAWSFGSLAGICLVIQIISGIFLAMHYTPNIDFAFSSIEYIMRDVPNGWLVRYIHANGSSMFFMVVYAHMGRGLYYGSYMIPREMLWCSGVVLYILMMATAFTGYVLPWGQMSFWGVTVTTHMVTILPYGKRILEWVWGGYVIGSPTLRRIFSIHFVLPWFIAAFSLIHLALLHKHGSNSPLGSDTGIDDVPFYPYFVSKDGFAFSVFLLVFGVYVFYFPNTLNHPLNCIPANPYKTPPHVVPEWYFLTYFSILRAIPHKTGGILIMFGSVLLLFTLPYFNTSDIRNTDYRPIFKYCFWFFVTDFLLLIWLGKKSLKYPYPDAGKIAVAAYYFFFIFLVPVSGIVESKLVHYGKRSRKKIKVIYFND